MTISQAIAKWLKKKVAPNTPSHGEWALDIKPVSFQYEYMTQGFVAQTMQEAFDQQWDEMCKQHDDMLEKGLIDS